MAFPNDYISRKALIDFANNQIAGIDANDIARFPAADVREVKHGRWVYEDIGTFGNPYGRYVCSSCGEHLPHKENYCPNCGTKMDGGKDDES